MKYLAGLLITFFSFVGVSNAQHRAGGGGKAPASHESHGGPAPFHPTGHVDRGHPAQDRKHDHFNDDRRHSESRDRWHYDGRHFDRTYHERFFGRERHFFVGHPTYYLGGYRFFYGGFWYRYDVWPSDWCYCDQVYIDYDYDTDCYYMYNPFHPGLRLRIGVIF